MDLESVWQIGQPYQVTIVTGRYTGTLVGVTEHEIVLQDVAWVPDGGEYRVFVSGGTDSRTTWQSHPEGALVILGRGALVEASIRPNPLRGDQEGA